MELGAQLAREHPVEADIVIGVPDSATAAAIGYARESGIPYTEALVKNRYVGRTFIQPDQRLRERGVQLKFNPLPELLEGKRVIVVDDTIVRGTTTPRVVAMLRKAGAREVHMRITSPPITHPCFFGVDMATKGELIGAHLETSRRFVNTSTPTPSATSRSRAPRPRPSSPTARSARRASAASTPATSPSNSTSSSSKVPPPATVTRSRWLSPSDPGPVGVVRLA